MKFGTFPKRRLGVAGGSRFAVETRQPPDIHHSASSSSRVSYRLARTRSESLRKGLTSTGTQITACDLKCSLSSDQPVSFGYDRVTRSCPRPEVGIADVAHGNGSTYIEETWRDFRSPLFP